MVLNQLKIKAYLIKYLGYLNNKCLNALRADQQILKRFLQVRRLQVDFLFGIFSSDVRKTFHCKNCGYKW